ncbi:MAG: phosphoribosyltransferase family protein [Thermaerobacter sp.]|nr:phosphoribosyltransferase family protein [Thermaerobacter sp.]
MYRDRAAAGEVLGRLAAAEGAPSPLVVGIARGGVEVAARMAALLAAPLEVAVARKVGVPGNPELAAGAVGEAGEAVWNEEVVRGLAIPQGYLEREVERQRAEVRRRLDLYRGAREEADPAGRTVYLVDDGLATGLTAVAAARDLARGGPRELVLAVPVASVEALERLGPEVDRILCPQVPEDFWAVGQFYEDFTQVDDARVVELLRGR